MKTILFLFLVLCLLTSCSLKPPQVTPTFLSRAGEFSCNMISGGRDVEMQVAVSPVKHLILIGELKTEPPKNYKTGERSGLGMGLYYTKPNSFTVELIHMASQFDQYAGATDQFMNGLYSASGYYNYTQTWLTIYSSQLKKGSLGFSLNYIDTRYDFKRGDFANDYKKKHDFKLRAININFFYSVLLVERLSFYFAASTTWGRNNDRLSPMLGYDPISFRMGLTFHYKRENNKKKDLSF